MAFVLCGYLYVGPCRGSFRVSSTRSIRPYNAPLKPKICVFETLMPSRRPKIAAEVRTSRRKPLRPPRRANGNRPPAATESGTATFAVGNPSSRPSRRPYSTTPSIITFPIRFFGQLRHQTELRRTLAKSAGRYRRESPAACRDSASDPAIRITRK